MHTPHLTNENLEWVGWERGNFNNSPRVSYIHICERPKFPQAYYKLLLYLRVEMSISSCASPKFIYLPMTSLIRNTNSVMVPHVPSDTLADFEAKTGETVATGFDF